MLVIPVSVIYFVIFVYAVTYIGSEPGFTSAEALDITTVNLVIMALFVPVCGYIADKVGLRAAMMGAAISAIVLALPCWWLMLSTKLELVFIGQLGLTLASTAGWALSITGINTNGAAAPAMQYSRYWLQYLPGGFRGHNPICGNLSCARNRRHVCTSLLHRARFNPVCDCDLAHPKTHCAGRAHVYCVQVNDPCFKAARTQGSPECRQPKPALPAEGRYASNRRSGNRRVP